jgi:hypothetical protein
MTTRAPRIQITLQPDTRSIFIRLAAAQDRPVASVIAEFLEETAPALSNVVRVVESAKNAVRRTGACEREKWQAAEAQLLHNVHQATSALHSTEATLRQFELDVSPPRASRDAAPPRRAARARIDPTSTNRGVNKTRKQRSGHA